MLVEVAGPEVHVIAEATGELGIAALFGIAEKGAGSGPHITQVYCADGEVQQVQRKRHLGENEEPYLAGSGPLLIGHRGKGFGVAICAERNVDYPFSIPAKADARVVFHCFAPGLCGRRTDEAGWKSGFDWWRDSSIEMLIRHASENNIWIAATGQAGQTVDEDFPGWAALFDPHGELVAELPDWQEGVLIVDIPPPA